MFAQYDDIFDRSLGLLAGDIHLETDPNVALVQMLLRCLPVAIRDYVEAELTKMVKDGIITLITELTCWVSALLIISKTQWRSTYLFRSKTTHYSASM